MGLAVVTETRKPDLALRMTLPEYAAHRGCSYEMVRRYRADGRLVLADDGRVLVAATDAILAQSLHPTRGGRGGSRALAEALDAAAPESPPAAGAAAPARAAAGVSMLDAARAEKLERVRKLRLEIAAQAGQLVDRAEVERHAFARARQAQEALLAIADRLAPQLAAETDPQRVHALIDAEVRRVARELAEAGARGGGDA